MILALSLLLYSCQTATDNTTNTTNGTNDVVSEADTTATDTTTDTTADTTDTASDTTTDAGAQTFTLEELKTYDGQNGNPAYVAFEGIVYDVTNAEKWNNGKHENGIVAGIDLTDLMSDSPHGISVLEDVPVVGTLE
ncbi:MAG: hypothetical protein HGA25_01610 [Clostridiales bacterium]|nr:hypothetical protein [Clostridiales bacterium]